MHHPCVIPKAFARHVSIAICSHPRCVSRFVSIVSTRGARCRDRPSVRHGRPEGLVHALRSAELQGQAGPLLAHLRRGLVVHPGLLDSQETVRCVLFWVRANLFEVAQSMVSLCLDYRCSLTMHLPRKRGRQYPTKHCVRRIFTSASR